MTNIIISYKQNVTRNNNLKSKLQQIYSLGVSYLVIVFGVPMNSNE